MTTEEPTCELCDGVFDPAGTGEKPRQLADLTVCEGCYITNWEKNGETGTGYIDPHEVIVGDEVCWK